ncbi:MAG: hypothetical protein KKH21_14695, partial [Gammaproteobacteria bacterium]|nr:hypothetical protein [Gammaproteobacteria bacterium]
PVSNPALVKNATPTEINSTPVKMATPSSTSVWGVDAGVKAGAASGVGCGFGVAGELDMAQ